MSTTHYYELTWFDAADKLVGEERLPISDETVREWFNLVEAEDAWGACHVVTASQRRYLKWLVAHEIDLNEYDYFVEAVKGP